MAGAFVAIGGWPLWRGGEPRWWSLGLAALFLLVGWLAPSVLTPLNRAWMKLAYLMSRVVNPVVMAILFYGLFTPIAVFMRLFGRDALRLKFDRNARSYWQLRNAQVLDAKSLANQF